jgi:hypothetical protein
VGTEGRREPSTAAPFGSKLQYADNDFGVRTIRQFLFTEKVVEPFAQPRENPRL